MDNGKFIHVCPCGQWCLFSLNNFSYIVGCTLPCIMCFQGVTVSLTDLHAPWPPSLRSALHPSPWESQGLQTRWSTSAPIPHHVLISSAACSHLLVCLVFCWGVSEDPKASAGTISISWSTRGKLCIKYWGPVSSLLEKYVELSSRPFFLPFLKVETSV